MRFDVITLFPELFAPFFTQGVTRRAFESGRLTVHLWNLREFGEGPYRRVDDRPYGGGPGMVMLAEPLWQCLQQVRAARGQPAPVLLFSPAGRALNQAAVERWAAGEGAILICGRYEGVDQRFVQACVDEEISLGDFVLSGGEIAALALIDALARLQPGVLNDEGSHQQDSFGAHLGGLLDCPHYSRPEVWQGQPVPAVLLSGHHAQIEQWRREQSRALTAARRPDLLRLANDAKAHPTHEAAVLRDAPPPGPAGDSAPL
ncbi:MAG: tRNA (guanosine(37)-N1)-methyltransferase TrmD [Betaproteobacteria bacterium]